MNTHADKTSENKSLAVANSLPKQQTNGESAFQFVDNKPEAIAQRKLREAINNSPRVQQLKAYQTMADSFTSQFTQRTDNFEEEIPQGKIDSIQKKENNTGLPDNLKSGIENLSGYSMDDVKVHYNSDKPTQLQAHAYAQGTDIHLASGQEKHLSHEAWHVVQQKQGRVKPTMQMKDGVKVNDDAGLEHEADVMGGRATSMKSVQRSADRRSQNQNSHAGKTVQQKSHSKKGVVQRVLVPGDQAPSFADMLSKRFNGILNGSEVLPNYDQILAAMNVSLTAYSNHVPVLIATSIDCAIHGIHQALGAGMLNDLSSLQTFIDNAELFSSGHVGLLVLNQAAVTQIITDQVGLALHNALKSTINENINAHLGIDQITQVIRDNTNGLTIPPQNAQELFFTALHNHLQVQPIATKHGYQEYKNNVLTQALPDVIEQYFNQLPGTVPEKEGIARASMTYSGQRFQGWEQQYLKKGHKGLADVQTALTTVNVANNMNIADIRGSYQTVVNDTGNQHLANHPQNIAFVGELSPENKIALTYFLKTMPVVKAILETHGISLDNDNGNHTWQNPALMVNTDNPLSVEEAKAIQDPGHQMQIRIGLAMRKMNNLVSSDVLNNTDTPNMVLHKDLNTFQIFLQKKYDNIFGFRAFANNRGHQVNVGLNESVEVIMHEMGHLIEDNIGTKEWLDIQSLLHMRHEGAEGGNTLSHVYDTGINNIVGFLLPSQAQDEPAYRGNMPATGRYSAKYYDSGSTEVMSMTLEHFGNREKALNIINNDPLQAAIILRAIQPAQFHQDVVVPFPAITGLMP